jgi:hypothetical protein
MPELDSEAVRRLRDRLRRHRRARGRNISRVISNPSPTGGGTAPGPLPPARPETKEKSHVSTWISLVAAAAAIIAAAIAYLQVNVVREQNVAADQQQLLALTTTIGQQLAQAAMAENQAGTVPGAASTQAQSTAQIALTAELTSEGEAAAVLINTLGGNGVVGIEYIEAGEALAEGDNIAQALTYFQDAVNAPPQAPGTRASALRSEAVIYYSLGQPATGHYEMILAVKVYTDHRLKLTKSSIYNSIAQSYLDDAAQQLDINGCKIAAADINAAAKALSQVGTSGTNATNKSLSVSDLVGYLKHC